MPFQISKNLAQSTLASGYTAGNTTITVQTGDGAKFESSGNFVVAIGNPPQFFLKVTGVSTDTFTVDTSGFDGSTAVSVGAATSVTEVITAGVLQALLTAQGGMVLLAEQTAAVSAELDFTTRNAPQQSGAIFQADFDEYVVEVINLIQADQTKTTGLQVSTNGGSSYITTSSYAWLVGYVYATGTTGGTGAGSATSMLWRDVARIASGGWNGTFRFFNPASTTATRMLSGQFVINDSAVGLFVQQWAGQYTPTGTAINAFRVIPTSSDTLTSGTVRVYGIAK
jgi:hypothetical protein